jgi:hypothetical protein
MVSLALQRISRHKLSNQREDLDKAIVLFTESILIPPLSWLQHGPIILKVFLALATSLLARSDVSKQPEDAICATKYFFHLRDQPHEIPGTPRHPVTGLLVEALCLQVELKVGNVMQNIREIAVLSRELLTLGMPDNETTHLINLISKVVGLNICNGVFFPDQLEPVNEMIECLRAARKCRPDLLRGDGLLAFAMSLRCRHYITNVDDDYEEATSILDEILTSRYLGNSQDEHDAAEIRAEATSLVTSLAMMRSTFYRTPENLEEAIYRARRSDSSSSNIEQIPSRTWDPEATARERFRYFGSIEGVEEPSGFSLPSRPLAELPENLKFRQALDEANDLLFVIRNNDDTTKIDEAVEKGRSILLASDLMTGTHIMAPLFTLFGQIIFAAFRQTEKIEYLNEAISIRRQAVETSFSQAMRFASLYLLSQTLLARNQHFPGYSTQDLDEGLETLSQYVNIAQGSLPDRFRYACQWAFVARLYRHSSVSSAYETALSLMQDITLFSPTLQLQHATLVTGSDNFGIRSLPLDYASYQLDHHQLEEAIETLERGRALLWSEMRRLRASIGQLLEEDSELGYKFAAVNRDLEKLTKSVPPSHKLSMDDGAADGLRAVDPFGRLVLEQRGLLKERANLISQIQTLPGFNSFLTSPPFDTLRTAALSGPVIIINHSEWRSDILILLHNKPPSLIPTPHLQDCSLSPCL